MCRYVRELIQVEGTTPGEPIRFPTNGTNGFIPGAPRRVSAEGTIQARASRAANVAKHVMTGGGRAITLEGTSANHPEMNAAENMAALAACIRAAICDIDHKYPGSIKSCVAVVELSNGVRQNRADAHGALVIHGDDQLLSIAEDFQSFLIQRGVMNRAMHETDGTRVVIVCGVDRIHRFYEWMRYCTKAEQERTSNQSAAHVQRLEEALQDAGINVVGNSLDNPFILHKSSYRVTICLFYTFYGVTYAYSNDIKNSPESTETMKITRKLVNCHHIFIRYIHNSIKITMKHLRVLHIETPRTDCEPRNWWYNLSIQLLVVLFTYMAIITMPWRCAHALHSLGLCRPRRSNDDRKYIYGLDDDDVWFHIPLFKKRCIIVLLLLNCIAQYLNQVTHIVYHSYELSQATVAGRAWTLST